MKMKNMNKILLVAVAACAASAFADTWPERLWLGRGGFWTKRVGFAVTNAAEKAAEGLPVSIRVGEGRGELPLADVRIEELRLTDARGVELLYGVWMPGAAKQLEKGPIPAGAEIAIPLCAAAKESANYLFYFGNPDAWALADRLKGRGKAVLKVDASPVETLAVTRLGEDDAWTKDGDWAFRVPIRVANFSDEAVASSFAALSLRDAVRGARNPEWRVEIGGKAVDGCLLGDQLLFACGVPARTILTCWMYVRDGAAKPAAPGDEPVRSALGSVIPSDQVLVTRTRIGDETAYRRLVESSANLVKNPCFAAGAEPWTHTQEPKDSPVRYEVVSAGGKFGGGFAKMVVPPTASARWRGWYQTVPLKPGRSYIYGGCLSGDDVDGKTTIAAHVIGKDGKTTKMLATSESISGTAPWTPTFGRCTAGKDDAKLVVHLTSRQHGTFAYDGILVAEHLSAAAGDPESPAAADGGLAVRPVDPIVKVFRETTVRDCADDFAVALARNETEPLQLAVRSAKPVARLEIEVTEPTTFWGRGGVKAEVGVVGYVPVDHASAYYSLTTPEWELKYPTHGPSSDGRSGWWPDPIRPENACSLAANVTQAIWINFKTTAETKSGTYTGKIRWKADGEVVRTDGYEVKVWDFTLPAVAETPAIYDIRLGRGWDGEFKGLSPDERRRTVWKFYSEKRICPDSLDGDVKFVRGKDGRLTADFAAYDRLAAEYFEEFKFPVSYTPRTFYCFGWGMPPKKLLGEQPYEGAWPFEGADRAKLRPAYVKAYQDALRLYWNHMKEKGWAEKLVLYISDEPHFAVPAVRDQMIALCRMIHEVDPAIRIYSSTWRHCPAWNDSLDVWGVAHYGGFPVPEMKARAEAGKHIWFTTDGQMCLDTPFCAVERLLPHYCAAFRAEAYEFWGATWLTYDPWKFGWHAYIPQSDTPGKHYFVRYPDGDGYLMYPGVPGAFKGPVTSVRLEAARDGVEDFSYLKALQRLAAGEGERAVRAGALLKDFAALVTIPNAGGRYSTRILSEPEKVGALRLRAGELLDGARP